MSTNIDDPRESFGNVASSHKPSVSGKGSSSALPETFAGRLRISNKALDMEVQATNEPSLVAKTLASDISVEQLSNDIACRPGTAVAVAVSSEPVASCAKLATHDVQANDPTDDLMRTLAAIVCRVEEKALKEAMTASEETDEAEPTEITVSGSATVTAALEVAVVAVVPEIPSIDADAFASQVDVTAAIDVPDLKAGAVAQEEESAPTVLSGNTVTTEKSALESAPSETSQSASVISVPEVVPESDTSTTVTCDSLPDFAIICSFLDRFGSLLAIQLSIQEVQIMLEQQGNVSEKLIDVHIKLLRKIVSSATKNRFEKYLAKFCDLYLYPYNPDLGAQLLNEGYTKLPLASRVHILRSLLEFQFDFNQRFKTQANERSSQDLRVQPLGRDADGFVYWLQVDEDLNVRLFTENLDDEHSFRLLYKTKEDLAELLANLKALKANNFKKNLLIGPDHSSESAEKKLTDKEIKTSTLCSIMETEKNVNDLKTLTSKVLAGSASATSSSLPEPNQTFIKNVNVKDEKTEVESELVEDLCTRPNGASSQAPSGDFKHEHQDRKPDCAVDLKEPILLPKVARVENDLKNSVIEAERNNLVPDVAHGATISSSSIITPADVTESNSKSTNVVEHSKNVEVSRNVSLVPSRTLDADDCDGVQAAATDLSLPHLPTPPHEHEARLPAAPQTALHSPPVPPKNVQCALESESSLRDKETVSDATAQDLRTTSSKKDCESASGEALCGEDAIPVPIIGEPCLKSSKIDEDRKPLATEQESPRPVLDAKPALSSAQEQFFGGPTKNIAEENDAAKESNLGSSLDSETKQAVQADGMSEEAHKESLLSKSSVAKDLKDESAVSAVCSDLLASSTEKADKLEAFGSRTSMPVEGFKMHPEADDGDDAKTQSDGEARDDRNGSLVRRGRGRSRRGQGRGRGRGRGGSRKLAVSRISVASGDVCEKRPEKNEAAAPDDSSLPVRGNEEQSAPKKAKRMSREARALLEEAEKLRKEEEESAVDGEEKRPRRSCRMRKPTEKFACDLHISEDEIAQTGEPFSPAKPRKSKATQRDEKEVVFSSVASINAKAARKAAREMIRAQKLAHKELMRKLKGHSKKRRKRKGNRSRNAAACLDTDSDGDDDDYNDNGLDSVEELLYGQMEDDDENDRIEFGANDDDDEFACDEDIADNVSGEINEEEKKARTAKEDDADACRRCGKVDHPEFILLCDTCDAGWHMNCLRPPLMLIPLGSWHCPPCEHTALIEALDLKLTFIESEWEKRQKEITRKQRLAFVSINIGNVLPTVAKRKAARKSKMCFEEDFLESEVSEVGSTSGEGSSSNASCSVASPAPRRRRAARKGDAMRERMQEYEKLMKEAIDGLEDEELENDDIEEAAKPRGGKDMSNILGASDDDSDKAKKKKKSKLVNLSEDEEDDDSEFQASEFSGEVEINRKKRGRSTGNGGRRRGRYDSEEDDDDDSESISDVSWGHANRRRSGTQKSRANRRRSNFLSCEKGSKRGRAKWDDADDSEGSVQSFHASSDDSGDFCRPRKRQAINYAESSDEESDIGAKEISASFGKRKRIESDVEASLSESDDDDLDEDEEEESVDEDASNEEEEKFRQRRRNHISDSEEDTESNDDDDDSDVSPLPRKNARSKTKTIKRHSAKSRSVNKPSTKTSSVTKRHTKATGPLKKRRVIRDESDDDAEQDNAGSDSWNPRRVSPKSSRVSSDKQRQKAPSDHVESNGEGDGDAKHGESRDAKSKSIVSKSSKKGEDGNQSSVEEQHTRKKGTASKVTLQHRRTANGRNRSRRSSAQVQHGKDGVTDDVDEEFDEEEEEEEELPKAWPPLPSHLMANINKGKKTTTSAKSEAKVLPTVSTTSSRKLAAGSSIRSARCSFNESETRQVEKMRQTTSDSSSSTKQVAGKSSTDVKASSGVGSSSVKTARLAIVRGISRPNCPLPATGALTVLQPTPPAVTQPPINLVSRPVATVPAPLSSSSPSKATVAPVVPSTVSSAAVSSSPVRAVPTSAATVTAVLAPPVAGAVGLHLPIPPFPGSHLSARPPVAHAHPLPHPHPHHQNNGPVRAPFTLSSVFPISGDLGGPPPTAYGGYQAPAGYAFPHHPQYGFPTHLAPPPPHGYGGAQFGAAAFTDAFGTEWGPSGPQAQAVQPVSEEKVAENFSISSILQQGEGGEEEMDSVASIGNLMSK